MALLPFRRRTSWLRNYLDDTRLRSPSYTLSTDKGPPRCAPNCTERTNNEYPLNTSGKEKGQSPVQRCWPDPLCMVKATAR